MSKIFHLFKSKIDIFVIVFLLVAVCIPAILPYFHVGYFPTHDGEWAVVRLGDMYREIKDLQIPPRYSGNLNFGYGYPLFNFAYPFPYYLGLLLYFFGFGFVDSIKILFAVSVPLAAFFMFLLSREVWKSNVAGVISSILYIYLPYRFVDLYVRGSIGESLAFALFPLILFSLIKLFENPHSRLFFVSFAISLSALVMTHNIMTVLFMPVIFVVFTTLCLMKNKKPIKPILFTFVLGLMISSIFWIPAIVEKNNIVLSKVPIADRSLYFVTLPQLFIPSWGYGTPTESNGFSYQLGWPHIFAVLLVLILVINQLLRNKKRQEDISTISVGTFIVIVFIYICMLFRFSAVVWENIPLLKEINYPWTLLAPLGFLMSLIAGFLGRNKQSTIVGLFLTVLAITSFVSYARPQYFIDKGDLHYLTNDATTTSSDELMPLWVKSKPTERAKEKVVFVEGTGVISDLSFNSKNVSFTVSSQENAVVRVNTIYYPGWKAYVEGEEVEIDYQNENGVMEVHVNQSPAKVELIFSETPIRLFADILSVVSLCCLLLILIKKYLYGK